MQKVGSMFDDPASTKEEITAAASSYILRLYGAKKNEKSLTDYQYTSFLASAVINSLYLVSLPPTVEALSFHSFRCFHQIQKWRGDELSPIDWGWHVENEDLMPTKMTSAPAPDELLTLILCACKKGCLSACSCTKAGLLLYFEHKTRSHSCSQHNL